VKWWLKNCKWASIKKTLGFTKQLFAYCGIHEEQVHLQICEYIVL